MENTPKQLHEQAMQAYTEALYHHKKGNSKDDIIRCVLTALGAELKAVFILNDEAYHYARPTQAILCRSAATMALMLSAYYERFPYDLAEKLTEKGLSVATDPVTIEELKVLQRQIQKQKAEDVKKIVPEAEQLFMPVG